MIERGRNRRVRPPRGTLHLEALEDRTVPSGVVQAALSSGLLEITGDSADNQFTLAPSPVAGMLRISGDAGTATSINGAAFADFALNLVTDIRMTLLEGLDKVALNNFNLAGTLTILYGNMDDVFRTTNFRAAAISVILAGPGGVIGSGTNNGLLPPVGVGGTSSSVGWLPLPGDGSISAGGSLLPPLPGGGSSPLPP